MSQNEMSRIEMSRIEMTQNEMTPTFDYRSLEGTGESKSKIVPGKLIKSTVESFRTPILKMSHSSYELQ